MSVVSVTGWVADMDVAEDGLLTRQLACLAGALVECAAQMGRVLVYPTVRVYVRPVPFRAARVVYVRADTALRPAEDSLGVVT